MADNEEPVWKDPEIGAVRALLAQFRPPGGEPQPWAVRRAGMDAFGALSPPPEGTSVVELMIDGVPAERMTPPGADTGKALLYLHGGGYCQGSPASHRGLAARLAAETGVQVLVPHYRLAPEHPFPAAIDDALKAYRHLLAEGIAPAHIAIAGDSAGGGLTLALALALRQSSLPRPGCLFAISPWVNLTQTGVAYEAVGGLDPMLTKDVLDEFADAYLGTTSPLEPLASPALGDLTGLPPLLIHAGGMEVLASDAALLAERAGLAGVDVRLEIWPEMIHVWHAFFTQLAAGRAAISAGAAWMKERLA